jgi:hypothetical protein
MPLVHSPKARIAGRAEGLVLCQWLVEVKVTVLLGSLSHQAQVTPLQEVLV